MPTIEIKEQAHQYIIIGRTDLADKLLKTCKNMLNALINHIEAQSDKHIPFNLANVWTGMATEIISKIDETKEYISDYSLRIPLL